MPRWGSRVRIPSSAPSIVAGQATYPSPDAPIGMTSVPSPSRICPAAATWKAASRPSRRLSSRLGRRCPYRSSVSRTFEEREAIPISLAVEEEEGRAAFEALSAGGKLGLSERAANVVELMHRAEALDVELRIGQNAIPGRRRRRSRSSATRSDPQRVTSPSSAYPARPSGWSSDSPPAFHRGALSLQSRRRRRRVAVRRARSRVRSDPRDLRRARACRRLRPDVGASRSSVLGGSGSARGGAVRDPRGPTVPRSPCRAEHPVARRVRPDDVRGVDPTAARGVRSLRCPAMVSEYGRAQRRPRGRRRETEEAQAPAWLGMPGSD